MQKKDITRDTQWNTGAIIGKCENILIITFTLVKCFYSIALIFAAKTIIKKDITIFDKGYHSYQNYQYASSNYKNRFL